MNKTTLTTFLLALLLASTQASTSFLPSASQSSPLALAMNALVTDTGAVAINQDSDGYYIEAETNTTQSTNLTVKMMLALSSSDTILAGNCFSMTNTFCPDGDCGTSSETTLSHPYFSATVKSHKIPLIVDRNHWSLSKNASLAVSCTNIAKSSTFGRARSGVIGLGVEASSGKNFLNSKTFTIDLDAGSETLYFKKNLTKASSSVASLTADSNWRINDFVYVNIGSRSNFLPFARVRFDINYNKIGLPRTVSDGIMNDLKSSNYISCSGSSCTSSSNISNFPVLYLKISGNNIGIPATIYANTYNTSSTITFNFEALGSGDLNLGDSNEIVLGSTFMKYYLTVFGDSSFNNGIYLYKIVGKTYPSTNSDSDTEPKKKSESSNGVGKTFLMILALCCISCCSGYLKHSLKARELKSSLNKHDSPSGNDNISQAPYVAQASTATQQTGFASQTTQGYQNSFYPQQTHQAYSTNHFASTL